MSVDTKNHIEKLSGQLDMLKSYYPELSRLIEGASKAIDASRHRAIFPERNTASRARESIAGSVGSILNAIAHDEQPGRYIQRLMLNIVNICNDLLENIEIEATKFEDAIELDGWKNRRNKLLVKKTKFGTDFVIVFKPHLPGGDWVLHFGKVQIAYAETAYELAELSERFSNIVAKATAPPPMSSRSMLDIVVDEGSTLPMTP